MARVLILTASFGDGHNTAARGVAAALGQLSDGAVSTEVRDFVREAEPVRGAWLQHGYKIAITHLPWVWRQLYELAERLPLNDDRLFFLGKVERLVGASLASMQPDAVVCTFPLYPHLIGKLAGAAGPRCPLFTVVTDSITINEVWYSPATDYYFAPDELSAAVLRRHGVADGQVVTSGFPVDPIFASDAPEAPGDRPRRILYLPTSSRRHVRRAVESMLGAGPEGIELTVVFGRHELRLRPVAAEIERRFRGGRVRWLGWTSEIPALMESHDLVIGKAGGATTHECLAAGRPLVITQIVPGQEEGNAELIQRRRSGLWVPDPGALGPVLKELGESGRWAKLRHAAWTHRRADGALRAARFILDVLSGAPGAPAPADP